MNYKPRAVLRDHCDWIRCLGLSSDDSTVASGCVSSNVVAWDVETGRLKFKVSAGKDAKAHHAQASRSSTFQRSINSLQFSTVGVNVFATGIRDGSILLWDARSLSNGPVLGLKAHLGKLNQIQLGHCDNLLLSGGRDGAVRLWDMRKLGGIDSCAEHVCPPSKNPALRMEYKSHRCTSYNISCVLLNYDRYIATGSEDRKVWIYDACTGKTVKVLEGHSAVAHFVHTPPETDSGGLLLASSSIDSSLVNLWSPAASMDNARPLKKRTVACLSCESPISCCRSTNMQESEVQGPVLAETAGDCQEVRREVRGTSQFPEPDEMVDPRVRQDALQKKAVEELMHKHGDIILRVFHHYDYSFRSPFDWQALLNHVRAAQELHLASNGSLGAPLEQTLMNSLVEIANDFQEVLRRFTERQAALPVQPV